MIEGRGAFMTKRVPWQNWIASKATAIILMVVLLPLAILGLSWLFDFVSKKM